MEDKKITRKNSVRVVGYLKENLLEQVKYNNNNVIRGSIIIATSELDSHKVQFFVKEKNKDGQINKDYESLCALLPENTMSIATYLKNTPTANFATASNMSTKVWASAQFDEFTTKNGDHENRSILLKGRRAGFKTATDSSPFVPGASFTCDVYIDSIGTEVDEHGNTTGRATLEGYYPVYDGSVMSIDFVAPAENNVAKYILNNYTVGDTVTLTGDVLSIIETQATDTTSEEFFGRGIGERQYNTKFIRERRIFGGSKTPIHQGEEGCITSKEITDGLIIRDEKIIKNSANSRKTGTATPKATPVASRPTPTAPRANEEDFDF